MAVQTRIITFVRVGVRMRMMEMVVEEEGGWQAALISARPRPAQSGTQGISPRSRVAEPQRCARSPRSAVEGEALRRAGRRRRGRQADRPKQAEVGAGAGSPGRAAHSQASSTETSNFHFVHFTNHHRLRPHHPLRTPQERIR